MNSIFIKTILALAFVTLLSGCGGGGGSGGGGSGSSSNWDEMVWDQDNWA